MRIPRVLHVFCTEIASSSKINTSSALIRILRFTHVLQRNCVQDMIKHILGFEAKCMFYSCFVVKSAIQLSMKIQGFEDNSVFDSCFIVNIASAHHFNPHYSHQIDRTPEGARRSRA